MNLRRVSDAIAARPSDAGEQQWETALRGLRKFIADGHGVEAERLGWLSNELYRVPKLWSQSSLCGAGLLIGDATVVGVTTTELRIRTAGGSSLAFYRRPPTDYALAYRAHLGRNRHDNDDDDAEAALRALERTVDLFREKHPAASLEEARAAVPAILERKETSNG